MIKTKTSWSCDVLWFLTFDNNIGCDFQKRDKGQHLGQQSNLSETMVGSLLATTTGDSVPVVLIRDPEEMEADAIEPGEVAESSRSELAAATVGVSSSWARALYDPLLPFGWPLLEFTEPRFRFDPKRLWRLRSRPNPKSRFLLLSSCFSASSSLLFCSLLRKAACSLMASSLARLSAWQGHSLLGTRQPIIAEPDKA